MADQRRPGGQLGNPQNMMLTISGQGQATMKRNAREHQANRQAAQLAELLRAKGQTLTEIAAVLTATGTVPAVVKRFALPPFGVYCSLGSNKRQMVIYHYMS